MILNHIKDQTQKWWFQVSTVTMLGIMQPALLQKDTGKWINSISQDLNFFLPASWKSPLS